MKKRMIKTVLGIADFFKRQGRLDLISYAASIAFFLYLSLIPILILLSFIIPLTGYGYEELVAVVTDITPEFLDGIVTQIIVETYNRTAGLLPMSVIMLLWTASGSMFALIKGLQRVYGIKFQKNMFLVRLRSVIYMVVVIIFFIASVLYVIFQDRLIKFFTGRLTQMPFLSGIFLYWRHFVTLPLFIIFLVFIYYYMSAVRGKWRYHMPGALLTTALWYLFSYFFSLYVSRVDPYESFYGGLSVIVVLLLWLYFCCYILLIGGYLNRYIMENRGIPIVNNSTSKLSVPRIMAVHEMLMMPWKSSTAEESAGNGGSDPKASDKEASRKDASADEEVITLTVHVDNGDEVSGSGKRIYYIRFHGEAESAYFKGSVLPGGVDVQTVEDGGKHTLSARYILEGKDCEGTDCRIYIENNGLFAEDGVRTTPTVVTDSKALSWLMESKLYGVVEIPANDGDAPVIIRIFREG